jgi:invasion protein IalB
MADLAIKRVGIAALAAVASATAAPAQTPQRTTASYQDWTVRCETRGTPPVKACEMVQAVTSQGQTTPIAQVAVGRTTKADPIKMVFQLPINVFIPTGVRLSLDAKDKPLAAGFRSCVPAGCFAEVELRDDLVKRMRARTDQGRFEFKDAAQRDVAIPISFKGFGQALDALAKE